MNQPPGTIYKNTQNPSDNQDNSNEIQYTPHKINELVIKYLYPYQWQIHASTDFHGVDRSFPGFT